MSLQGQLYMKGGKAPFTGSVRVERAWVSNPKDKQATIGSLCQVIHDESGNVVETFNGPEMPYVEGRDPCELTLLALVQCDAFKGMTSVLEPGQKIGPIPSEWSSETEEVVRVVPVAAVVEPPAQTENSAKAPEKVTWMSRVKNFLGV